MACAICRRIHLGSRDVCLYFVPRHYFHARCFKVFQSLFVFLCKFAVTSGEVAYEFAVGDVGIPGVKVVANLVGDTANIMTGSKENFC